ncbi:MAG: winged helix-turn-helix transcriptional regulator [Actinobacteria bacterium]|nr:winged helix-turn-helix transcriptional regulator [Actinomycetota bacterium]
MPFPAGPPAGPPGGPPASPPVGLRLSRVARSVSRAFDDALAGAGGSLPVWLVMISLKSRKVGNQRELADAVGIREATLTHHLNAMDAQGLVTRRRDPANRRVHLVELTEQGEAAFGRLREAAAGFDRRLRQGFSDGELDQLAGLLERLERNAAGGTGPAAEPASPGS